MTICHRMTRGFFSSLFIRIAISGMALVARLPGWLRRDHLDRPQLGSSSFSSAENCGSIQSSAPARLTNEV